jgi:DNA-binding NarL/FixJ family response regulator
MSNRKISQVLGLKEQSIKNLVSGAMKNLQAENRTQLVLRYLEMAGPELVGDR